MKIAFRADASLQIGTGHVMRCLTLARALRAAGAECHFILRALPGHLANKLSQEGFAHTLLPAPTGPAPQPPPDHAAWAGVDWAVDAQETRAVLDGMTPDWLVMDHYAFDARWQNAACPAHMQRMVIDDLADRPHECDLLLDQNLGRTASDYDGLVPDRCIRLIGPHYALLRPEFAALRAASLRGRAGRGLHRLMISMGGVDADDTTSRILQALSMMDLPDPLDITVVMGGKAPALDRVRQIAASMPRPTEVVVDVPDMAARMASADLAIGAGGATSWERCAVGLPTIILQIAANQASVAKALSDEGAALNLGSMHAPEFVFNLRTSFAQASASAYLCAMSKAASAICDGNGGQRVVCHIEHLLAAGKKLS